MKYMTEEAICQTTLHVESATLELGENGLTIRQRQKQFARQKSIEVRYFHVLWAQATTEQLTIHYAAERHKTLNAAKRVFQLLDQGTSSPRLQAWIQLLLDCAYGEAKARKHLKIYLNPFSGKGSAIKLYHRYAEPLFEAAQCRIDLHETRYSGHASRLVREDHEIDSWDAIVCCSGDGLPYEIINGIAQRDDAGHILRNVPIVQLPGGSGNAMCVNMFKTTSFSHAALYTLKGIRQPIDLMSVTQGDKRYISFLSQNVGLLAECDLDTESMRFLGGKRFAVGFLQRLFNPPVQINGENLHGLPDLRFGSVNDSLPDSWKREHHPTLGVFFAGQFPFVDAKSKVFPDARPDDGLVDIIIVDSGIGTWRLLQLFKRVPEGNHLAMHEVHHRKVSAYRVVPVRTHGAFSIDGERSSFQPFQVEVHPQLGMTLATPAGVEERYRSR
ncbi:ATP-NAD kinase-like domain-containing protein [Penicillium cataractarum]|uniref:ATP-NAD kinase-like domain-containing protein n=1 Tax=Penicillium cataractarum TaxID=2100454 RepID=A0A9W9UYC1_9EURO|nr:ATP-NAD kinase-like domain-containing protein [Penicillium cataractarum]KAJ5359710.1 ATP-NAD kinase-like domain-containing protein [Penicillium cataractarum]